MGPFTLQVGCTSNTVSFNDDPSVVTSLNYWIGDSLLSVYNFVTPTSTKPYCNPLQNFANVTSGGSWYTGGNLLTGSGAVPYTTFDLANFNQVENINFFVGTMFTGEMMHNSPSITLSIVCNNNYAIDEGAFTSPQYQDINTNTGFVLPPYTTSMYQTQCPVFSYQISTGNADPLVHPSGLNSPVNE